MQRHTVQSHTVQSHTVAVLAVDGTSPLTVGIPAQVFGERFDLPYRLTMCGLEPEVRTSGGFTLNVPGGLAEARRADTLIIPSMPTLDEVPEPVIDAIRHVHTRGRRVVSICAGAFALAAAGVLDGRRATTHWSRTALLAERYPRITVDRDVLYVDEGDVLTSAGMAAGIDLCLHLVRRDLGAATANTIARLLVTAPHRDGGQSQFIESPVTEHGASLGTTKAWALDHLDRPLSIAALAEHARMSPRTLARRFQAETGCTPLQWLLQARVDRARELLESSDLSVEQIALRTGLGTAINLRVHFRRIVGTTPTAYRRSFSDRADAVAR
jgi:transcriptional regulator GlxA family with amidase domain